jgi:hypothetical protein
MKRIGHSVSLLAPLSLQARGGPFVIVPNSTLVPSHSRTQNPKLETYFGPVGIVPILASW